jgi:hypothetical protein
MTERLVRHIKSDPPISPNEGLNTFSDYRDFRNIVLLGDPGAGKSHLFRYMAKSEGGAFITARSYLNRPSVPDAETVFIDALDEKRSGRSDSATIDAMVTKLFSTPPQKVRISCRAQDWLGDTDLSAFEDYFGENGGYVVLSLGELTEKERDAIILSYGFTEPSAFVDEAKQRQIEYLLTNPQNLRLLCETVSAKKWPTTRTELFSAAIELLLSETNETKATAGAGVYSASELLDAAGAVCSVRLVSDIEAISRLEHSAVPDIPSYRAITCEDIEKVGACLGRRLFVSSAVPEAVEYVHRTLAEFVAAKWLAKKIRGGLPFGRVRALLGVDGQPMSELRGLHAWLAVLLPEHAEALIVADPYGVLTYSDASTLSPSHRKVLLRALGSLSERDPWFRRDSWILTSLGALSSPDLVEDFREILRSTTANFAIKSCVFQAIEYGRPLPDLTPDLLSIVSNSVAPHFERAEALGALVKLGQNARDAAYEAVKAGTDCIQLDIEAVRSLYGTHFNCNDVVDLLKRVLVSDKEDIASGILYRIDEVLQPGDKLLMLDSLPYIERPAAEPSNLLEVAHFVDRLLIEALDNSGHEITGRRLWSWLLGRNRLREKQASAFDEALVRQLNCNRVLLHDAIRAAIDDFVPDDKRWLYWNTMREATLSQLANPDLIEILIGAILSGNYSEPKQECLFEFAMISAFAVSDGTNALWERLSEVAETRPALQSTLTANLSCPLDEWRTRQAARLAVYEAKRAAEHESTMREFAEQKDAIVKGEALDWAEWLAGHYLARLDRNSKTKSRSERLAEAIGEENVAAALSGLLAVPLRRDIPDISDVIETLADDKYYKWWFAIVAGLDEAARTQSSTHNDIPTSTKLVAFLTCIEMCGLTSASTWSDKLLAEHPEQVKDALVALASAQLGRGKSASAALDVLFRDPLSAGAGEVALKLLQQFPAADYFPLKSLLLKALETSDRALLADLTSQHVFSSDAISTPQQQLWLAAAYLLDPAKFEGEVAATAEPAMVWRLRALAGYGRHTQDRRYQLELGQLVFLAKFTAGHFANCDYPGSSNGDENAWNGAEFVKSLIASISNWPSETATGSLEALLRDSTLSTYSDHLKHALVNQRTRKREVEYKQPDFGQAILTLSNNKPFSGGDLHALVLAHLEDANTRIGGANVDLLNQFWNEGKARQLLTPKSEEACRDGLANIMRPGLLPLDIWIEPEGHMADDKRADIIVLAPGKLKAIVELKRDTNSEVWSALENQLERLYLRDPDASGYGIYAVFWFGSKRKGKVPPAPCGARPTTAAEMAAALARLVPREKAHKLSTIVVDVSDLGERVA